jgi:alanyl-tRNA synthetase
MTERLYYDNPHLREFDATVVSVEARDRRVIVTLDRTAFYPTSGGQPFDTGTLGPTRVVDVVDDNGGTVAHLVEQGTLQAGERVHGAIDWTRRFDHMQQHTGQHVLSAAFDHLFHVRTVSFHLGTEASTIDLVREMSPEEMTAAEGEANRIVWEDRPVTVRYATADEAAALRLRKEPVRDGTLRLVDVERFDLSACGGTHVSRTGAIGMIAIASWEEQKRSLGALQIELARHRASELLMSARPLGTDSRIKVVLRAIDADANGLKALGLAVAANPGCAVVLVSAARPSLVVVARAADVPVAANQVLAALIARFGGRGGGKPDIAQGGGLDAPAEDILAAALNEVESAVRRW